MNIILLTKALIFSISKEMVDQSQGYPVANLSSFPFRSLWSLISLYVIIPSNYKQATWHESMGGKYFRWSSAEMAIYTSTPGSPSRPGKPGSPTMP